MRKLAFFLATWLGALGACTFLAPLDYLQNGPPDAAPPADVAETGPLPEAGVPPAVSVAENLAAPQLLVQDTAALYWFNAGDKTLVSVPKAGGAPHVVSNSVPGGVTALLSVNDDLVYAVGTALYKVPKVGGSTTPLGFVADDAVTDMAFGGGFVFITTGNITNDTGSLTRLSKDGSSGDLISGADDAVMAVAYDAVADQILWFDDDALKISAAATSFDGGVAPTDFVLDDAVVGADPGGLFLDKDNFYLGGGSYGVIQRTLRVAGAKPFFLYGNADETASGPDSIAVDETDVWFVVSDKGEIHRVPKTGSVADDRVVGADQVAPTSIVVDSIAAYFLDQGNGKADGALRKILK